MNSNFLKPTVGKVISTLLFALLMLPLNSFFTSGFCSKLTSYIVIKGVSFIIFLVILYFLSCLIFNEFKWYKSFLFLVMGIAVILAALPGYGYYSYLLGQAESCSNCFGGPICTTHPFRTCECLGKEIGVCGIDAGYSKCLGETKYTYYWAYANYNGKIFSNAQELLRYCEMNASADKNCDSAVLILHKFLKQKQEGVLDLDEQLNSQFKGYNLTALKNDLTAFLKTFNSVEGWQQYCDGLNEGSEKDGCYISLNEAVTWKAD